MQSVKSRFLGSVNTLLQSFNNWGKWLLRSIVGLMNRFKVILGASLKPLLSSNLRLVFFELHLTWYLLIIEMVIIILSMLGSIFDACYHQMFGWFFSELHSMWYPKGFKYLSNWWKTFLVSIYKNIKNKFRQKFLVLFLFCFEIRFNIYI